MDKTKSESPSLLYVDPVVGNCQHYSTGVNVEPICVPLIAIHSVIASRVGVRASFGHPNPQYLEHPIIS